MIEHTGFVHIKHITVQADRVILDVQFSAELPRTTTPAFAERLLAVRPRIAEHACVNSKGTTFAAVLSKTSLPHVLEHLAIDILIDMLVQQGSEYVVTGTSEWIDSQRTLARIQISCPDDLLTLSACNQAVSLLCSMLDCMN